MGEIFLLLVRNSNSTKFILETMVCRKSGGGVPIDNVEIRYNSFSYGSWNYFIDTIAGIVDSKVVWKKVIMEVHIGNQLIPYANNKFFKWWFKQADLILLLAHKWEQLFKELYSDVQKPTDVLYNACEIVPAIPFEQKKKHIIFAGTIHDNKAPDLLLKAWSQLKDKYPDWRISFMGSGNIAKYNQMAEELNISNCVEFTGYIVGDSKKQKFHDASIYCMCSYVEGFPMVILEAWSYSIAVITTPVGGLPDVIEDGHNCLTFPFGEADKLAFQLERLISDEQLRMKIGSYGYKYAQEHFSLYVVSKHLESIYFNLLKSKRSYHQ